MTAEDFANRVIQVASTIEEGKLQHADEAGDMPRPHWMSAEHAVTIATAAVTAEFREIEKQPAVTPLILLREFRNSAGPAALQRVLRDMDAYLTLNEQ